MRLLILGANGRTGQFVTADALKRGYTVTALVRKPESITPTKGLDIVKGTPTNHEDIERAFAATPSDPVTAVMVALNATRASDSPFAKPLAPPDFLQNCVNNAIAAMQQHNVRRIIVLSAFGIGNSYKQMPLVMKFFLRHTNMSVQIFDHEDVDRQIREHDGLDWTLVRPCMLKDGESRTIRQFGEEGKGASAFSGITRASVAEFMVDTITDTSRYNQAIVITN